MGTRFTTFFALTGGGKRDRTADLLHAMQALSQLSYTPKKLKPEHLTACKTSYLTDLTSILALRKKHTVCLQRRSEIMPNFWLLCKSSSGFC